MARIGAVRDTIRQQLTLVETDTSLSKRSLIAAIHTVRGELLRTTDDLLRRRFEALAAGAEFKIEEPSFRNDPRRADSISKELQVQRDSLRVDEQRGPIYAPSSLLGALERMQIETRRMNIDMLEMARISAQFGIGLPSFKSDSTKRPLAGQ